MMWIILGLLALYVVCSLLIDRGRDDYAPFDARESRSTKPHADVHVYSEGRGGVPVGDTGAADRLG